MHKFNSVVPFQWLIATVPIELKLVGGKKSKKFLSHSETDENKVDEADKFSLPWQQLIHFLCRLYFSFGRRQSLVMSFSQATSG